MADPVVVSSRFNGPLDSGNGGYSAGLFAARLGEGPATVTLRSPIPLDTEIEVESAPEGEGARFLHGETLIAEAVPAPGFDPEVPRPPSVEEAGDAAKSYAAPADGLFASCFVCGRARHDSFQVFAGRAGEALLATPWTPPAWTAGEDGEVRPEFAWAVLDCPTYFAAFDGGELPIAFMAQVTGTVIAPPLAGDEHVVAAWPLGGDGRKHRAGSGLFTAAGRLLAACEVLLIEAR